MGGGAVSLILDGVTTWTTPDQIPDHIGEVYGGGLTWTRDIHDWWTAVTPEGERLALPGEALLECCGTVTSHRVVES